MVSIPSSNGSSYIFLNIFCSKKYPHIGDLSIAHCDRMAASVGSVGLYEALENVDEARELEAMAIAMLFYLQEMGVFTYKNDSYNVFTKTCFFFTSYVELPVGILLNSWMDCWRLYCCICKNAHLSVSQSGE